MGHDGGTFRRARAAKIGSVCATPSGQKKERGTNIAPQLPHLLLRSDTKDMAFIYDVTTKGPKMFQSLWRIYLAFLSARPYNGIGHSAPIGNMMAKGQQKKSREARKPKADKGPKQNASQPSLKSGGIKGLENMKNT
jgi:hypothetical protein